MLATKSPVLSQLTLSWWRPLSHRNQSIDLLCKLMDWFLYDNSLRHERDNVFIVISWLHFWHLKRSNIFAGITFHKVSGFYNNQNKPAKLRELRGLLVYICCLETCVHGFTKFWLGSKKNWHGLACVQNLVRNSNFVWAKMCKHKLNQTLFSYCFSWLGISSDLT